MIARTPTPHANGTSAVGRDGGRWVRSRDDDAPAGIVDGGGPAFYRRRAPADALHPRAAAAARHVYDREPGNPRGEYAAFHLKRER